MKRMRLGKDLEEKLRRASERSGRPESEIIREGVELRCGEILGETLADRVADVIGSLAGDGSGWTRASGAAYARSLQASRRAR